MGEVEKEGRREKLNGHDQFCFLLTYSRICCGRSVQHRKRLQELKTVSCLREQLLLPNVLWTRNLSVLKSYNISLVFRCCCLLLYWLITVFSTTDFASTLGSRRGGGGRGEEFFFLSWIFLESFSFPGQTKQWTIVATVFISSSVCFGLFRVWIKTAAICMYECVCVCVCVCVWVRAHFEAALRRSTIVFLPNQPWLELLIYTPLHLWSKCLPPPFTHTPRLLFSLK